jgi:hypothetical protein
MSKTGRLKINEDTKIDILVNMEQNPHGSWLKKLKWKVLKTPCISDHYIIFLFISLKIENYEILMEKRNYKEYDKEAFQYMIRDGYEWNNSSANVNSLADAFTNSLKETINRTYVSN